MFKNKGGTKHDKTLGKTRKRIPQKLAMVQNIPRPPTRKNIQKSHTIHRRIQPKSQKHETIKGNNEISLRI
jgi:hypothetical protein